MLSTTITTMFATFVAFVGGVIVFTDAFNKLFKIENSRTKLILSWVFSIVFALAAFYFQLGFFAECGPINAWQGWVKAGLIGLGAALSANKIYDREEVWSFLEWIFSFFKASKTEKK